MPRIRQEAFTPSAIVRTYIDAHVGSGSRSALINSMLENWIAVQAPHNTALVSALLKAYIARAHDAALIAALQTGLAGVVRRGEQCKGANNE